MRKITCLIAALFFSMIFIPAQADLKDGLPKPVTAPEIALASVWLNGVPMSLKDIKGKVVLLDFWTYSCINCLRTLPYLKAWYERYKDQGLVVIGVHSPEFDFEKSEANVEKAIKRFKIPYPVVLDNDRVIWKRYSNQYWPAHYLINREGQVVYSHFGEGKYDVTEYNIRQLLEASGGNAAISEDPGKAAYHQTPETYLGTARAERFLSPAKKSGIFAYPEKLDPDGWALKGQWRRDAQMNTVLEKGATLKLHFRGGKVFLVMGVEWGKPVEAKITYNGEAPRKKAGKDAPGGKVTVTEHRLYEILDLKGFEDGTVEIEAEAPGLQVYAFTFGDSGK